MRPFYKASTNIFRLAFVRQYAKPVDVRFIQSEAQQQKEVMARYKSKLEKKAKAEGLKNSEELKAKLKDKIDQRKKAFSKVDPLKELENIEKAQKLKDVLEGKKGTKKDLGAIDPATPKKAYKTLNSYVKLDMFEKLPASQINLIWRARFQTKERSLCAIIEADTFDRMFKHAVKNPRFILPLPKLDAKVDESNKKEADVPSPSEMHFIQWAPVGKDTTHLMITSLAEFKMHKEFARPHTTIEFHSELKDSKGVVLMNGQIDKDAAVSLKDAKLLLLNLQRFYGGMGETSPASKERIKLVEQFNQGSTNFDVKKFLKLAQTMEN